MDSLLNALVNIDTKTSTILIPIVFVTLAHLIPYLVDPYCVRSYPGPFLAKFSDAWLGWVAAQGHRSDVVHQMHLRHGMCHFT